MPSPDIFPGRLPLVWKFQGSNNGTDWIDLDSRTTTSASWESTTLRTFTLSNPGAYTRYRIYITQNGGDGYTSIRWLQLRGPDTGGVPCLYARCPDGSIKVVSLN